MSGEGREALACRTKPGRSAGRTLFDVLHLLAELFDLVFHGHAQLGNARVRALGAERVDFPQKLLQQEIQPPANRFVLLQKVAELTDVAADFV